MLEQMPADEVVREVVDCGGIEPWGRKHGLAGSTARRRLDQMGLRAQVRLALDAKTLEDITAAVEAARGLERKVMRTQVGEKPPSTTISGDKGVIVTRPAPKIGDPDEWVREAGLDPEEWEAYNLKLNTWDAMTSDKTTGDNRVVQMFQVTANCRRRVKLDWLFPAVDVAQRPAPQPSLDPTEPIRVTFFPDQHAPYHDEHLHHLAMCRLADRRPDRIVNLGDLCDFPQISRHRDNPAYFASSRKCVQAGFGILHDQRTAAPDALIDLVEGNHDARPRTELLTRAERMFDLKPAQWPGEGEPIAPWSLRHLLHLDRLHVTFVGPELEGDNYFQGLLKVTPDIAAIHGFLTGAGSEKATVERLGMSTVFGHIHTQRVIHVTKYKGHDVVNELVGITPGTMRSIRGGGGFAWNPNWQQGFLEATIWPDGQWDYAMARFDGKTLTVGGERYR